MKVELVSFGVANRYGETIEINKALLKPRWKRFHDWVMMHEEHHDSGAYTKEDFFHDMNTPLWVQKESLLFMLTEKGAWWQLVPIWYYRNEWIVDRSGLLIYAAILLLTLITTALYIL